MQTNDIVKAKHFFICLLNAINSVFRSQQELKLSLRPPISKKKLLEDEIWDQIIQLPDKKQQQIFNMLRIYRYSQHTLIKDFEKSIGKP